MAITFNEQSQELTVKHSPAQKKSGQNGFSLTALRSRFMNVSTREKLFFVQQIGIMIQTGISLAVAVKTLAEQTKNKNFKHILEDLQKNIEKGNTFTQGLEKYQHIFGELFINMVRAGEASGRLEEVLKQIYIQLKKDNEIVSRVRGAMIYPSIVMTAMVVVGTLVMIFVIPNLLTIFNEVNVDLPIATKILIKVSNVVQNYGLFLFIGFSILLMAFIQVIRMPQGKYIFHKILLAAPILGSIIQKINLARFCRTLSSLLKTDIAIVTSFEITSKVLGNELYKRSLNTAKDSIKKGRSIHDSLSPYRNLFPPVVLQMISVGEETGALDSILQESAGFFEDEVDQTMKNLPSIIEPVLILILGLGVAGMAVAVIMPLYSLSSAIS